MNQKKNRPNWDQIFLMEAILWSQRSLDPRTKCGCVLVRNKTVLSTGYNSFVRDINDFILPMEAPLKYEFFLHAEHNAVLNCARNGISTFGATAYITGKPCHKCLQTMWQVGIKDYIYTDYSKPHMVEGEEIQKIYELLKIAGVYFNTIFIPYKDLQWIEEKQKTISSS